jgi:hypothetical protein
MCNHIFPTTNRCCSSNNFFVSLFDLKNVKRAFRTTFKRRPYNVRPYLLILASVFIIEIFMSNGRGPTMYLFLRKEFQWNTSSMAKYMAVFGVIGCITQYMIVPFLTENKRIRMRDSTLAALSLMTSAGSATIVAFASDTWEIYVAGLVSFLGYSSRCSNLYPTIT